MRKLIKKMLPKKISAGLELLEAGKQVKNVEAWKKGQVGVEAVSAFAWAALSALAVYFNVEVQVGEDTINTASAAIIGVVASATSLWGAVSTVITTNKIGLDPTDSDPTDD